MAKACIVTYDEYINIPYVKDYEKLLSDNQIEYDFIFWNRSRNENPSYSNDNAYYFNWQTKKSKLSKIIPFFLWSRFARSVIKRNRYDFLIVCTTIPAILLTDLLIRNYHEKFLLDIRDFTYENFKLYRLLEKKLITAANLTVISSKGFLQWLPEEESAYVLTHNIAG